MMWMRRVGRVSLAWRRAYSDMTEAAVGNCRARRLRVGLQISFMGMRIWTPKAELPILNFLNACWRGGRRLAGVAVNDH